MPDESIHSIAAGGGGPTVVCMPGYAAGAAFFYRNLSGLSKHTNVHLVDWLGTGLSGRPPFQCKGREETEAWFVESLERWRKAQGIENMVLVGHSLGGYLSASYALRYPERVKHLVLVNPAGMVRCRALLNGGPSVDENCWGCLIASFIHPSPLAVLVPLLTKPTHVFTPFVSLFLSGSDQIQCIKHSTHAGREASIAGSPGGSEVSILSNQDNIQSGHGRVAPGRYSGLNCTDGWPPEPALHPVLCGPKTEWDVGPVEKGL